MSPLVFLLTRSFKNALLKRLGRFKEPKYLFSMLAFFGYLGLMILPSLLNQKPPKTPKDGPDFTRDVAAAIATGLLMVGVFMSWIFTDQTALAFSMAEANLLFTAPLSRASLLRMRILTPQFGIVLSSWVFLFMTRRIPELKAGSVIVGGVLALEVLFLNRLAAALARVPRGAKGRPGIASHVGRGLALLALVLLGLSLRRLDWSGFPEKIDLTAASLRACADTAPASWVLMPFEALIRPALARTPGELLAALPIPAGVILAYYLWIVHGGVLFEEAALGASEAKKKRLELFSRTGTLAVKTTAAKAPFPLAPTGPRLVGLAWKNYLGISRTSLKRLVFLVGLLLAGAAWIPRHPETAQAAPAIVAIAFALAGMVTFMAPDALRQDLRTSLKGVDFLKTLPLKGWAIVLGEIAAPVLVTLAVQAFFLALATVAFDAKDADAARFTPALRGSAFLAALIFLGPIDLLLFVIANGAAVCFPSWVPLGARAERGGEQFGVNILLQLARLLLLAVGLIPSGFVAAVVGGVLWMAKFGPLSLPIGALAGALVLAVEDGVLIWFLGGVLERFDPAVELG
jgi:hypothetical protein